MQIFAKSLIAPVTLLAFAGLFLGLGAVLGKYAPNPMIKDVANVIKAVGQIVFVLLPLLFAIAIASAFTNNSGTAVLAAVIAYFALLYLTGAQFSEYNLGAARGWSWFNLINYQSTPRASVITTILGIKTLQFSVFGGFLAGPIAVMVFNKFKDTQLPVIFSMFQGHRLVPIMAIVYILPLALLLGFIWPWFLVIFQQFGILTSKIGGGGDSFLFGLFERALLPTGLHHMFYSPLLYTVAGGSISAADSFSVDVIIAGQNFVAGTPIFQIDATPFLPGNINVPDLMPAVPGLQAAANTDVSQWPILAGDRTMFQTINGSDLQFSWFKNLVNGETKEMINLTLGRFSAGKFPLMVFWIPAGGVGMIMATSKKNRKKALGVVFSAALTSFLTGITEPFEFTFLFVAPFLFFGFHIWMAGLSYWLANLAGVNYGPTFGGIIDMLIYGIAPHFSGQNTNFWWLFIIGIIGAPIYYFVFYYAIKKYNLKTPGRDEADHIQLITKKGYQAVKKGKQKLAMIAQTMIKALGGKNNLKIIDACASRLRITVKDEKLINYQLVKTTNPFGIIGQGQQSLQFIYGPNAIIIRDLIRGKSEEKK